MHAYRFMFIIGELCACVVVHIDFRWNCCSVHWSIVIVRGNEGVFSSL